MEDNSAGAAATNKSVAKSTNHDGNYSQEDTRALLHALQTELRAGGVVGPSGVHMMSTQFLRERRTSIDNDTKDQGRPKEDPNKQSSAMVDSIFLPRARGFLTRAVSAGGGDRKKKRASAAIARQQQHRPHARSSPSLVPASSPFMASLSSLFEEEITDLTTNKESAMSRNNSESIKKEHDENLEAAREYAATMRRLSTLNITDEFNQAKPRRKPRRSNDSNSPPRHNSFGNLANSFVDTIEAAINDLSKETNSGSSETIASELTSACITHSEEQNVATELRRDLRRRTSDRSSIASNGGAVTATTSNSRRSRSPSSVIARGA